MIWAFLLLHVLLFLLLRIVQYILICTIILINHLLLLIVVGNIIIIIGVPSMRNKNQQDLQSHQRERAHIADDAKNEVFKVHTISHTKKRVPQLSSQTALCPPRIAKFKANGLVVLVMRTCKTMLRGALAQVERERDSANIKQALTQNTNWLTAQLHPRGIFAIIKKEENVAQTCWRTFSSNAIINCETVF